MKMENDIREDMEEMFDYERKPYSQWIFGHLYIYHHKTLLHVGRVTPSVKLRNDMIYLIHFYETSVLFSQLFASRKLRGLY